MDLSSGYLLLEDISDDRRFETWHAKTSPRLEALGIEVSHAISDRAKALIKLAVTGFECASGTDLFHAQQDLSRWLGSKLARHAATEAIIAMGGVISVQVLNEFSSIASRKLRMTYAERRDAFRTVRAICQTQFVNCLNKKSRSSG